MPRLTKSDGTVLTKTAALALTTDYVPAAMVTINEDIWEEFALPGKKDHKGDKRKKYAAGQVVPKAEFDRYFTRNAAVVSSVVPATGLAAGGTAITINGSGFSDATAAQIGGTNCTSFVVVSDTKITAVTPAKTAGTYAVGVVDGTGTSTKASAFTTS